MAAVLLASCGGGGGAGEVFADTFGTLSLGISDGLLQEAQKVCVTFTDIELKPMGGTSTLTLTGQVANALAEADACAPSVYVFNDGVPPNSIEDDVVDPEDPDVTAIVEAQDQVDGTVQWHYTIGFLLAGEYEAAFTCDGNSFEPEEGKPATIATGETAVVDFEAPAP